MKTLSSQILPKKVLIEGCYNIDISEQSITDYFNVIAQVLQVKADGEAVIFLPNESDYHQSYEAFIPLIHSGISLYVWKKKGYLSVIFYTEKDFDEQSAIDCTANFFKIPHLAFQEF